jgi:hypothetical protein
MKTLVTKAGREPPLPLWIPEIGSGSTDETAFRNHVEALAIPTIDGLPSLLLHDLGFETSAVSQKQAEYICGIFSFHRHRCVDN